MASMIKAGSVPALLWAAAPALASACPNCYGAIADSDIAAGIRLAMLVLVVLTAMVGTGIVLFASNIRKRTRQYERSGTTVDTEGRIIPHDTL